MMYLSLEDILRLHFKLVEDFGGSHGVRDEGRLQAVVAAPQQNIFGRDQYPGIHLKAAVYMHNIIADHPFIDGNKRSGVTCAAIFLARNGYLITVNPHDLEDFAVSIATDHLDIQQIADWLQRNSRQVHSV